MVEPFLIIMALAVAVYSLSARAAQDAALNATECLPSCAKQYRTLAEIVLSCFTTIFLCIWVSLHLNVPEPVDTEGMNTFKKFKVWIRLFIRCNVIPVIVTLVFPEWVLGMAVLQFRKATRLAKEIGITRQHGFFIIMGGFHLFERSQAPSNQIRAGDKDGETHPLVKGEGDERTSNDKTCVVEEFDTPIHPLDEFDVRHLIYTGKLRLPTTAELRDKCKNDGIAKFLVILQTLWFIAQCITRKVRKLPLTELEVITLGYTLLTVLMYIAWWDKPYRVTFPIRVYEALPERTYQQREQKRRMQEESFWGMTIGYAMGLQSDSIELRSVKQAPMFHSGSMNEVYDAGDFLCVITTVIVGVLFGGVHFLAWSSPFPSAQMQFLWRLATLIMTATPLAAVAGMVISAIINQMSDGLGVVFLYCLCVLPPCYFVGRGITIVIALVTLSALSLDIYQDVEWSNLFPHI